MTDRLSEIKSRLDKEPDCLFACRMPPDDIKWLIEELEKARAKLDEHLGEQPKLCGECIKNYHTICQWEIEYAPGCVCGCHLARIIS